MGRKRVLIVSQHFLSGGIRSSLENLLPVLMERFDVKVMALCGSTTEFSRKYPGVVLPSPFLLSSALTSLSDLRTFNHFWLRLIIKIFTHGLCRVLDPERVILGLARMCRKLDGYDCVIAYSHDNWFEDGGFFGGANEIAVKRAHARKKVAWIHGMPSVIGLTAGRVKRVYSGFDAIVTVSEACKREFESLSNKELACQVVYNLINDDEIRRKANEPVDQDWGNCFKIVTVSRLSRVAKRVDRVNVVARMLKDAGYSFAWIVVGGGSEYERCVFESKQLGVDDCVTYVGEKSNPYPYMKNSDLVVVVSDSEAMPMVLGEAMIVGTPVVTTNFPAAFESIEDGKNGFVAERDPISLFSKIAYCIDHPEVLTLMREYIEKNPVNNKKSIEQIFELIGDSEK